MAWKKIREKTWRFDTCDMLDCTAVEGYKTPQEKHFCRITGYAFEKPKAVKIPSPDEVSVRFDVTDGDLDAFTVTGKGMQFDFSTMMTGPTTCTWRKYWIEEEKWHDEIEPAHYFTQLECTVDLREVCFRDSQIDELMKAVGLKKGYTWDEFMEDFKEIVAKAKAEAEAKEMLKQ